MHSRSFKYFYNAFIITLSRKYQSRSRNFNKKKEKDRGSSSVDRKLIRKGGRELISVAQGTSVNTLSSTYPSRERKKKKKEAKRKGNRRACHLEQTVLGGYLHATRCQNAALLAPRHRFPFRPLPFNPFSAAFIYPPRLKPAEESF